MAIHQLASFMAVHQFGGHRHSGSRDIIILGCHVIAQDHEIEGSCYFLGRSISR